MSWLSLNVIEDGWIQVQEVGGVHYEILPAGQAWRDCPVVE